MRAEPMTLLNGKERLMLKFDCKACEMQISSTARWNRKFFRQVIEVHPARTADCVKPMV